MDTSSYFQGTFLKVEDLAGEVMEATIEKVEEGRYGLVLILNNESQLSLNTTNGRTMQKTYGRESDDWLGKRIKLSPGEVPFEGKMVPSIILMPISPAMSASELTLAKRPESDIDDSIPF